MGRLARGLRPRRDHDPDEKRLELKFLKRFTPALRPASGVLLWLVPYHVLDVAAPYLSRHYLLPRAWRLPDPHFDDFRQVLLVARRTPAPLARNPTEATIRRWGRDPGTLDPLPELVADPLALEPLDDDLTLRLERFDVGAALAAQDGSEHLPELRSSSARELLGGRFHTAMPPRAAQIALALASGMFNGLQGSWVDQTRAPLPEARIRIVRRLADLEADAGVHIMSRETAKLGHAHLLTAVSRAPVPAAAHRS